MNTAIVTATAATVSPYIQNLQQQQSQKPQTSKEAIAAHVKALIEQLEDGHSEGLTEIARQKPTATRVAGMYAWNVEPARPQSYQGRERHPHLGTHDSRSPQEGRRSQRSQSLGWRMTGAWCELGH